MIQEWNIQGRAERCARTDRAFIDGEILYTLLHGEADGLRREDISAEAWEQMQHSESAAAGFTFWRSKFEPPPPLTPETVNRTDAETHLRRLLADGPQPKQANVAYLLAALLERKRILKPVAPPSGGGQTAARVSPYEHAKTGEIFLVPNAPPSFEQIEAVQLELTALLG